MTKNIDYCCIRCGYTTPFKKNMRIHFYKKKKPCPASHNDIELTDDIKVYILANRVYHIPSTNKDTIIINAYQQINNIVEKMDVVDKITKYNEYRNMELIDFEDRIEETYRAQAKKLEYGRFNTFELSMQNIMEIIDTLTTFTDIDRFNVIYDKIPNKLKIFHSGEWCCSLLDIGIKDFVMKIKECYLDFYECYLIRKINSTSCNAVCRSRLAELVDEYYKFLICFDIPPFIQGKNNNEVMYPPDDPLHHKRVDPSDAEMYTIEEQFMARYNRAKTNMMASDLKKIKKDVHEIIKKNTSCSVIDLNKKMMEIIQMDEDFKKQVIIDMTMFTSSSIKA